MISGGAGKMEQFKYLLLNDHHYEEVKYQITYTPVQIQDTLFRYTSSTLNYLCLTQYKILLSSHILFFFQRVDLIIWQPYVDLVV